MARILVVDDERSIRDALEQLLVYEGHEFLGAGNAVEALRIVREKAPEVAFLDVKLPGTDGLQLMARIRAEDPGLPIIMISGHASIEVALEATRGGAFDFLEKPLDSDRVLLTARNALEIRGLSARVRRLQGEVESRHPIVGQAPALLEVLERVERVAASDARVLITGENGTGKELVARAIHRLSPRSGGPFVEVNCAAIPSELIESELFGHLRGAFTGAVADRAGKFEQAQGGTLFLDEVGDMSLAAQAKVLRALEQGEVTRVGGSRSIRVDVRVLAATNKDLPLEIARGRFREDLYYRLNVVPVRLPALRERREDIPLLVTHFAERMARQDGLPPRRFQPAALDALQAMPWPGNVRELRNTVERLLILAPPGGIGAAEVRTLAGTVPVQPLEPAESGLLDAPTFAEFRERAERAYIQHWLRHHDWNVAETARALGMARSNLNRKIERFGLVRADALPETTLTRRTAGREIDP